MQDVVESRVPAHLWIVGILALLWNGFGSYDYYMSRTHNDAYLKSMMPDADPAAMWAYTDGLPIWASFAWGLGVWMGLLGSILLLAKSRHAVLAFGLSAVGALVGMIHQLTAPPPGIEGPMVTVMPYVIILIAVGLFLYARAMRIRGVLR
jgi:hypothetical protein